MKLLVSIFLVFVGMNLAYADQGSYYDEVQFIQYLDENTALEEVKNGNLDLYYYRISSDRIENKQAREGIDVYESTGGSYSFLVNPAESEKFNPFSIGDVRYALNYLVDRKLIVNELMGGYGVPMISNYGPYDPDYLFLLDELEAFHFRYNPTLADEMISNSLKEAGAEKINGKWFFDDDEIEITIFIRSDDPVRKSIGALLSSELESLGFKVNKDFGDLNKAFVIVYGSNPADLKWNVYTEGWGGRSAFVKYDTVGLGQMYAPWFSNTPGFNDPSYWNYQNDYLDSVTQKIYVGNFTSPEERIDLFKKATTEGVKESVRIFLASKIDQYVVNEKLDGIINDFGAGVPSRFTPINARSDDTSLSVGVKQIYQGAWNPVMGISDIYSRQIWDVLYDPAVFKHPYTGETIPIRANWKIDTAGPEGSLTVPQDAIIWNPTAQTWENIKPNTTAISKVTFDMTFSNWHNGIPMDMIDVLHSLYFTLEWGSTSQENDKTFDTEYTPRASQSVQTLIGVNLVDQDTIDVYVDYWHFDEAEIADWASLWNTMPWELQSAMEQSVIDGKVSFSRSGAVSKNVNWLSLIVPNDAAIMLEYLENFQNSNYSPPFLTTLEVDDEYMQSRYTATIDWIKENNHAVISNGPYYLDRYSPESRTITIKAFQDPTYPFEKGHWSEFETAKFPKITEISIPDVVKKGATLSIPIKTQDASQINYFLTNSEGSMVASGVKEIQDGSADLMLTQSQTFELSDGANDLKLFAISDSILRPDIYSASFIAVDDDSTLPNSITSSLEINEIKNDYSSILAIIIGAIIIGVIVYFRHKRKTKAVSKST